MFFNITRYEAEEVSFHMFLKKMTTNYLEKEKFQVSHYEQEEAPAEIVSTSFFYQAIEIVVNCIRIRFPQKDHIESLQKMEILLLKALRDEDFDHELQQVSLYLN